MANEDNQKQRQRGLQKPVMWKHQRNLNPSLNIVLLPYFLYISHDIAFNTKIQRKAFGEHKKQPQNK